MDWALAQLILLNLYNNLLSSDVSRFKWMLTGPYRPCSPAQSLFSGNTPAPQGLVWDEELSKQVTKEAQALAGHSVGWRLVRIHQDRGPFPVRVHRSQPMPA